MKDKSVNYKMKFITTRLKEKQIEYKINLKMITIRIGEPTIKKR
jgi:hypothetical protein